MASYFNPMSALSMYGGSPYGQLGGYQSSLAPAYSPYDQQDPYAAMAPYGQDAISADQDPLAMLMSMLAPPPPPPRQQPPADQGSEKIVLIVLEIIKMLIGQQGKGNDCQPCQKKQQRSNDYGPQPQASNPSYAQYPDSQYSTSSEPDYTSVLNGSENPYQDYTDQSTYVPEVIDDTNMDPGNSTETELTGNSTDDGIDPFADSGDGF